MQIEHNIQKQIIGLLKAKGLMVVNLDPMTGLRWQNNAKKRAMFVNSLKSLGYTNGQPDICILFPNGGTVWLEAKRPATFKISEKTGKRIIASPAGKLSKEQQDWHDRARKLGHIVYTVYSVRAAEDIINEFLPRAYKIGGTI